MLRWLFYTLFSPTALQQINEAIIKLALLNCYFIHEWYRVWFILADWFQSLYSLCLILLTDTHTHTHTQHSNIREDERFKWWWVKRGGSVNAKHFIPALIPRHSFCPTWFIGKTCQYLHFCKTPRAYAHLLQFKAEMNPRDRKTTTL